MAITVVSAFKIDHAQGMRLAGQATPHFKRQGATMVRFGTCYSGPRTGAISVIVTYPDWQTYGKALHALSEDHGYQALLAEVMKVGELLDRSIMVTQEL